MGFIGATFVGRYFNLATASAELDSIETLYTVGLVGGGLAIASAVCGFLVVRELQARSDERAQSLGLSVSGRVEPTGTVSDEPQPWQAAPVPSDAVAKSKVCPRCAEDVKEAAVVCRYCGHEFAIGAT